MLRLLRWTSLVLLLARGGRAEEVVQHEVSLGATVQLPCDVPYEFETMWFRQRGAQAPRLVVTAKTGVSGAELLPFAADGRLQPVLDGPARSVALRIANVSGPDLALYFCADRQGGRLRFGAGARLVRAGEPPGPRIGAGTSPPSRNSTGPSDPEDPGAERGSSAVCLRQCLPWVIHVSVTSIFFILVTPLLYEAHRGSVLRCFRGGR